MGAQGLNIAGTIAVLSGGFGVRGLILNSLAIAFVNAVSLSLLAFRYVPSLRLAWRHCKMTMVKRFFRYGANLQVSKLAQVILFQTDRIITLRFFGEITNTHYDIGARVDNAARSITSLSLSALVPAVAELDAKQSHDTIMVLYKRGSKYIAVVATFLFVFVGVFAPQIIRVWMKEPYPFSAEIVRILAFGYFFNVVTGVASSLSAGVGKTEFDRKYGLFASTFNVVATISLSLLLGPAGVALGTSLSLMLGGFYFMYLFNGYLKVRMVEVMGIMMKPVLTGVTAGIAVWLLSLALPGFEGSRIMGGVLIGGFFAVYTGVFASLLALLGVLDDYDRQMIRVLIRKVL
jgi:O-antigen/teichoic acid export membrane protein